MPGSCESGGTSESSSSDPLRTLRKFRIQKKGSPLQARVAPTPSGSSNNSSPSCSYSGSPYEKPLQPISIAKVQPTKSLKPLQTTHHLITHKVPNSFKSLHPAHVVSILKPTEELRTLKRADNQTALKPTDAPTGLKVTNSTALSFSNLVTPPKLSSTLSAFLLTNSPRPRQTTVSSPKPANIPTLLQQTNLVSLQLTNSLTSSELLQPTYQSASPQQTVLTTLEQKNITALQVTNSSAPVQPTIQKTSSNDDSLGLQLLQNNGHITPSSGLSDTMAEADSPSVIDISSDVESPIPAFEGKRSWNCIASDSEDGDVAPKKSKMEDIEENQTRKSKKTIDSKFLSEKERSLRILMNTYPETDIMELQDVLVKFQWNAEKSLEHISQNPLPPALEEEKSNPNSSRILVRPKLKSSVVQKNSRVHCYSDSSEEEVRWRAKTPSVTYSKQDGTPMAEGGDSLELTTMTPQNNEEDIISNPPLHRKKQKSRRKQNLQEQILSDDDEEYTQNNVYDSDDSDVEISSPARLQVLEFFKEATSEELTCVPSCSKKKVESILQCRPFIDWTDLVQKFSHSRYLSPELLNGAKDVLHMRKAMSKLMQRCQRISIVMEGIVGDLLRGDDTNLEERIAQQPSLLNQKMHLAPYQMLGLNWLGLMHRQHLNGILADEMGLGKTIQAVAFLAYIQEKGEKGPHVIIVPSSTLDNWLRELHLWCPSFSVLCYYGTQESRRELRLQILNDEIEEFDIVVTTYNMVTNSAEDRSLFKRLEFHYVVFDEAHMLKNMASQRYQNLMKIRAKRRLLLTGTPLQNNLIELMSLLIFVMPDMFIGKIEQVKQMFSFVSKSEESRGAFEKEKIEHAKRIMKPFVLRRFKTEVLQQLPAKHVNLKHCAMLDFQREQYDKLVRAFSEQFRKLESHVSSSGIGMMMQLRKVANHPLLLRNHYSDDILQTMSQEMLKEPTHCEANPALILEDMQVMSDFELHKLCKTYQSISSYQLKPESIVLSGKFQILDSLLPEYKKQGSRVLLFSQFTMMLDIIEEYMHIRGYEYLRLDGSTAVTERQLLIDQFNDDPEIFIFLLSTRAGGLGINLTAASIVLLHDIDFNPYNDKQAEDRCHRVGQTKEVWVIRFISENSIEEAIYRRAEEKLKLERDVTTTNEESENEESTSVVTLLKHALGL